MIIECATIFLQGEQAAGIRTTTINVDHINLDLGQFDKAERAQIYNDLGEALTKVGQVFDPVGGVRIEMYDPEGHRV